MMNPSLDRSNVVIKSQLGNLEVFEVIHKTGTAKITNFGGGQVLGFSVKNTTGESVEAFYQNPAAITDGISPYRGGTQCCLFHIGPQKDDMPMHGLLRIAHAKLTSSEASNEKSVMVFTSDRSCIPEQHQHLWPADITVHKTVTISDNQLTEKYSICRTVIGGNTSLKANLNIPIMMHNYLNLPPYALKLSSEGVSDAANRTYSVADNTNDNATSTMTLSALNRNLPFGDSRVESTVLNFFPNSNVGLIAYNAMSSHYIRLSTSGVPNIKIWSPVGLDIGNLAQNDAHTGFQPTTLIVFDGRSELVREVSQTIEVSFRK